MTLSSRRSRTTIKITTLNIHSGKSITGAQYSWIGYLTFILLLHRYLVADGAMAIRNAFSTVFGKDTDQIMCWAHMKKCVRENVKSHIQCNETKKLILADIDRLKIANSPMEFDKAVKLFKKQWKKEEGFAAFYVYFEKEWLGRRSKWYKGAARKVPSTNNAIECYNRHIKKRATFRIK